MYFNNVLVTVMALNSDTTIPRASVMAKPRTIPVPNQYKIVQVIREDILESRIEGKARSNPKLMAVFLSLPHLSSSLALSNIRMLASTAMPTDKINPAIPARVRVIGMVLKRAYVIRV